MLLVMVIFLISTNSWNSYTWQPRKIEPKKIVVKIDQRMLLRLPFWIAVTESAIMSDDMSRMNVEKEVSSRLKIFFGEGASGIGCRR